MSEKLLVPQLNPNDSEAELSHWHKRTGDRVKKGDLLCDFSSSKAVYQHESPADGFLCRLRPAGSRLRAGTLMGLLCASEQAARDEESKGNSAADDSAAKGSVTTFSQAAMAKLRELGLKESDFSEHAFVTEKMVLAGRNQVGTYLPPLRKQLEIAKLEEAYFSALRSSLSIQLDAAPILKKAAAASASREAFLAWAVAQTLKSQRSFLQAFGMSEATPPVHISYALDLGTGIRLFAAQNAERWSASQWAEQIADWSLRLMRLEIRPEELTTGPGGFTISDLSSQGILFFEPLLLAGQSAILGIGGDLEAKCPLITFTLAFDHRLHDGRAGAGFLKELRGILA